MSFLNWFGKRDSPPDSPPASASGQGAADGAGGLNADSLNADSSAPKGERGQRRELLYGIVRECMTAVGLLSSTYKFKVLSLDSSGREFLVMVDLPFAYFSDPARLAEMEGTIARSAKERFGMLVTAVYWRVNDLVTARSATAPLHHASAAAPQVPRAAVAPAATAAAVPPTPTAPVAAAAAAPAPVAKAASSLEDEMLAFKRAAAAAASGAAPAASAADIIRSRVDDEEQPDFCDTQPFDPSSVSDPPPSGRQN